MSAVVKAVRSRLRVLVIAVGGEAVVVAGGAAAMHQNCLPKDKTSNGRTAAPISPVALFLPLPSEATGP